MSELIPPTPDEEFPVPGGPSIYDDSEWADRFWDGWHARTKLMYEERWQVGWALVTEPPEVIAGYRSTKLAPMGLHEATNESYRKAGFVPVYAEVARAETDPIEPNTFGAAAVQEEPDR